MKHRPAFYGHFNPETQQWDCWWIAPDGTTSDYLSRPGQAAVASLEQLVQQVQANGLRAELAAATK